MKFKNPNCDETHEVKLWQNSKTQIVTKLENIKCDNSQTQIVIKLKTKNLKKIKKTQRDRLHCETMDCLSLSIPLHSCQNILSEKNPGGFVGQGRAAGKPGQATM